ncbi:MAG: transglutaminase-like cysteine peptidase [Candidatus Accumulibacter sp.]|uniref:transglutaminase-like cysteine peptidase n=1 Tax=Accumulibacter sp. TaxID=2053492 RepID=UPI00287A2F84|nr:transglutaminase-like cysteine peptidase [Accumulibacter sp.]MDS4014420.1 transglutaminase-like cysteine peptidase [Accumulibacter sp.]
MSLKTRLIGASALRWCGSALALPVLLVTWYVVAQPSLSALQAQLVERFGAARSGLLHDWGRMLAQARNAGEEKKLVLVNDFFNKHIVFDEDISTWQQADYWATPLETIGQGRGDCEDFAIAKYFSLRMSGLPISKMRLVYVKAQLTGSGGELTQRAHMVLAYYSRPQAEPLVLDNLQNTIQPASKRRDLQPVFSFNSEAIFAGVSGVEPPSAGKLGRLSRWENLLQRARAEGFD